MSVTVLKTLSMTKYERLLPRVFPGVVRLELRDRQDALIWYWCPADTEPCDDDEAENNPVVAWSDFGAGIQRRQLPSKLLQVRAPIA